MLRETKRQRIALGQVYNVRCVWCGSRIELVSKAGKKGWRHFCRDTCRRGFYSAALSIGVAHLAAQPGSGKAAHGRWRAARLAQAGMDRNGTVQVEMFPPAEPGAAPVDRPAGSDLAAGVLPT